MSRSTVHHLLVVLVTVATACWTPAASVLHKSPKGFGAGGRQDWGHVTVRDGAHLFWWLHFTTATTADGQPAANRPLAIWLQGGPGASATGYGNFAEIGPVDLNGAVRNHTWVKDMHVLFIDAPVGSGFSWAESPDAFSVTDEQCGVDLVELMRGFYAARPEFVKVPVHVFAESYGGKVVVEFALAWEKELQSNTTANNKIKLPSTLRSINSVDGWISPISSMLSWAPFLQHTGFIENAGRERIDAAVQRAQRLIDEDLWPEATQQWGMTQRNVIVETGGIDWYNVVRAQYESSGDMLFDAADEEMYVEKVGAHEEMYVEKVGPRAAESVRSAEQQILANMYDMLVRRNRVANDVADSARTQSDAPYRLDAELYDADNADDDEDQRLYRLMNGPVRRALNISADIVWSGQAEQTFQRMQSAFMRPAIESVERLLNDTHSELRVNIISGQFDLIVATPGTVEWLRQMRWPGADEFETMERSRLVASGTRRVEGYTKEHDRLAYYSVNWAGHMVPADNPDGMDVILRRVTEYDRV